MPKRKQKHNNQQRRLANKKARAAARHKQAHEHAGRPLHLLSLALCRINTNWRENGAALIYVGRHTGPGRITAAFFYVDVWGVGVKDCFMPPHKDSLEASAWLEAAGERFETSFQECSEEIASQLVWGGLWYGREAGFLPPREFHECKKLIPRLSEDKWDRSLFGKDGERFVIGELRELMKRSKGRYDPDETDGHFLLGGPVLEDEEEDFPWAELLVEDEGLDNGGEDTQATA